MDRTGFLIQINNLRLRENFVGSRPVYEVVSPSGVILGTFLTAATARMWMRATGEFTARGRGEQAIRDETPYVGDLP
jgi:hypothetical protein